MNSYVEDETFVLCNVQNGPTKIGDLWNCHTSKAVGFNIFGTKDLREEHLEACSVNELTYTLTNVKSTSDTYRFVEASGHASLEILAGLIQVAEIDDRELPNEDLLLCSYKRCTFDVRARQSANGALDDQVVRKIINGEIKATHVVRSEVLGIKATAA